MTQLGSRSAEQVPPDHFGICDAVLAERWFGSQAPAPGLHLVWSLPLPPTAFATRSKPLDLDPRSSSSTTGRAAADTIELLSPGSSTIPTQWVYKPPTVGDVLGRCALEAELGRGGYGVVFRARHLKLGIPVAVKVLLPDARSAASDSMNSLLSEARFLAQVNHPNVVRVYDVDDDGAFPYLVMELVEGASLEDRLRQGALPPDEALRVAMCAAAGLSAALRYGVIHRDIKPANILIGQDSQVKLVDFGLGLNLHRRAEMTSASTGRLVGTVWYMAPEVVRCEPQIDHRADIYSLGATCYHLLTGRPPFQGDTAFDVAFKHVQEEPVHVTERLAGQLATLPPPQRYTLVRFGDVVMRMLAKEPSARFATYDELLEALRQVNEPIDDGRPTPKRSRLGSWFSGTFAWQRKG